MPLKLESIDVPNWVSSPFGPTAVKWEGVPVKNPGYGMVRSGANCQQPTADRGLEIMYGNSDLNGKVVRLTTRWLNGNGKPNLSGQETFSLTDFRVKNLNTETTGEISAELYLSEDMQGWQTTTSDDPDFKNAYVMTGGYTARVNPQQTIPLAPFWGMTQRAWPTREVVYGRLKIFYGAAQPAIANFRLRKIGVSQ